MEDFLGIDYEKQFEILPSFGTNKKPYLYYLCGKKKDEDVGLIVVASYNFKTNEVRIRNANETILSLLPLDKFVETARNDYMKGRFGL